MIKVNWDVEELAALIDVYLRSSNEHFDLEQELKTLSNHLNHRAELLQIPHDEKYRNYNGMKMMYQNVVYIANNGEQGLSAASLTLKRVFELLEQNRDVFNLILTEFYKHY